MPLTGWTLLAAWALLCLALGAAGTAIARRYALRRRLIDQPGERRSHAVATPRGGGIAIAVVMLLAMVGMAVASPAQRTLLLAASVGLGLVSGIGWIDDHRPLSAWLRLCVHAIAALLLAMAVWIGRGSAVEAVAAFVLALVLVNVWNFMDGIDGLAASQAATVAAGYALITDSEPARWLAVALAAACCGFLPYNFPKARIFLGDAGSGALGYALAVVAVAVARMNDIGSVLVLLPLSAFILDAALTLSARMLRRERWWMPHVQHAYQRWAASADNHRRVTAGYLLWSMAGAGVMVGTSGLNGMFIMCITIGWYLGGGIVWACIQARHGFKSSVSGSKA